MRNVVNEFVKPIYMTVLHGNFLRNNNCEEFVEKSKWILSEVTDDELDYMLKLGWREAIVASWIISLGNFDQHLIRMKKNLIPSNWCFSGQFHMIALARIGTPKAIDAITEYLDAYLPVKNQEYDQEWAFGALSLLDTKLGTNRAQKYRAAKLWEIEAEGTSIGSLSPEEGIETVAEVISFIDKHFEPKLRAEPDGRGQ